ncbi:hypothetical protein RKE29_19405 [Streptomyces sp. B1866]|uniref:hypothetical protein n=1 Tax=Streptomyces sp. B1866 TaxID=3075431 RepID=UPI00288D61CB|nr:hypothetical protein [Streptomyces sp. B1866]MDT3398786.1 hypothetical protein [Streptomyces sp. B1866]
MTAPLTPHDQPPHEASGDPRGDQGPARSDGPAAPYPGVGPGPATGPGLRADVVRAALTGAAVAVSGVLLGLLWLWLAPRVPLVSDGRAVYLKNSESEEAIGADGTFVLLGLAFGAVSAAVVFWSHRRGGVPLVVALAAGGLLGSVVAWRLGVWLGPESDIVAHARRVGRGVVFDGPLELGAKGALLAWPVAAMMVHLVLTGLLGPRDPEPDALPDAGPRVGS